MIRVALAVVIAAAIVAVSIPAIDHGAAVRSEGAVERALADIETAATDLVTEERLPPRGITGPQRAVTVTFPKRGYVSMPVETLEIERLPDTNASQVRYSVQGHGPKQRLIDAPIVNASRGTVDLGGTTGEVTLVLLLQRDETDGSPVVVLRRTSRR